MNWTRPLLLGLLAIPGASLILLGASGLTAGIQANAGLAYVARIKAEADAPAAVYDTAVELLAPRAATDAEIAATRGLVQLQRGTMLAGTGDPAFGTAALLQARVMLRDAVRISPLEPRAWAGLAWIELQGGNKTSAIAALRATYLSANVPLALSVLRIKTGMRLWAELDADDRSLVARDLKAIWLQREWRSSFKELILDPYSDGAIALAFAGMPQAAYWITMRRVGGLTAKPGI